MTPTKPQTPAAKSLADQNARVDANRRDDRRDMLVAKATISPATESPDKGKAVWLFNISEGGVGFHSNQSLEPGSIHHIKVDAGPFQLNNRIRIAWSRKRDDNTVETGGEFLPPEQRGGK